MLEELTEETEGTDHKKKAPKDEEALDQEEMRDHGASVGTATPANGSLAEE